MTFTKLEERIVKSSLWAEMLHVRVVFVSFLALKDENGFVDGAPSALQRICNVTPEQFAEAIKVLESPDPESTTKDFEGRRIEKVDGGWIVLNHEKYRANEQIKKEQHREYMREWREKKNVNNCEFTEIHTQSPSVSVSESVSSLSNLQDKNKESKSEELWLQFKTAYPDNGSWVDPAAQRSFLRLIGSGNDPELIIRRAKEFGEYYKDTPGYPHCKFVGQMVNWLDKCQFAQDWAKKLEAEKENKNGKHQNNNRKSQQSNREISSQYRNIA